MKIGDRVTVSLVMEIEGMKRDNFSSEILIEGKVLSEERGHYFVTVPKLYCKEIEPSRVVA